MTEQELKIEAKKLGYTISKKRVYEKLVPCSNCSSKKINKWFDSDHRQFYRCKECGKRSASVRHNYQARKAWNEANS